LPQSTKKVTTAGRKLAVIVWENNATHPTMKKYIALLLLLFIGDARGQSAEPGRVTDYDFTKTVIKICGNTIYYDSQSVDACSAQSAKAKAADKCDYYYLYREAASEDKKCYEGAVFPYGGARVFFTPGRIEEWHSTLFDARRSYDAFIAEEEAQKNRREEEERVKAAKANKQQQEKIKKFLAANPGCQMLIKELRWGIEGKSYFAEGNVTNLTKLPVNRVRVIVEWKSKDHIVLGAAGTHLDFSTLLPGQSCQFVVRQAGANPLAKYTNIYILDQSNQVIQSCIYK
jgi:hypothetical protein